MRQLIFTGFVLLGICGLGHASELGDEYTAYQDAAASGDLYAALPHAERAYELGLEQFGLQDRNTGLLAYNYGSALFEAARYPEAIDVFETASASLNHYADDEAMSSHFQVLIESSRANFILNQIDQANFLLDRAERLATETYGSTSQEAGVVKYHQARALYISMPYGSHWESRIRPWERETGEVWTNDTARAEELVRMSGQFEEYVNDAIELIPENNDTWWRALALRGMYYAARNDISNAVPDLERAIEFGHLSFPVSDDLIQAYSAYIWTRQIRGRVSTRTLEELVLEAYGYAMQRPQGTLIQILALNPAHDLWFPDPSYAEVQYDVRADGRVENVRLVEGEGSENFIEGAVAAAEGAVFAPLIVEGSPLPVRDRRAIFIYRYRP